MSEPRNIEELAAQLRERGDALSLAASGALLGLQGVNAELLAKLGKPSEWAEAERVRDLPAVDDAIRNFLIDSTGDNSTCIVREVLRAAGVMVTPQPVAVAWEYRTWRDGCGGEPVGWGAWERLQPNGLQTIEDAACEMRDYISLGYRYELRWLVAHPDTTSAPKGPDHG